MTREEAIFCEKSYIGETNCTDCKYYGTETCQSRESHKMAIKALKQEPCEDVVSRQAVVDFLKNHANTYEDKRIRMSFLAGSSLVNNPDNVPLVTPTRKKGKWINKSHKSGCGITFIASECTCCGKKTFFDCDELIYRFCPNCGADMREVGE